MRRTTIAAAAVVIVGATVGACRSLPKGVTTDPAVRAEKGGNDEEIRKYSDSMLAEG